MDESAPSPGGEATPPSPQRGEGQKTGGPTTITPEFTSLLFTLARVPGVFEEAFKPYRFRVPKSGACLVCGAKPIPVGDLDVAVGEALGRLGPQ